MDYKTSNRRRLIGLGVVSLLAIPIFGGPGTADALAQSKELNLYSARHYPSDNELYAKFTSQTGIKINQIQAGDEAILERLKSEGKASPADVILLVDAARLWKAESEGLFQPLKSPLLEKALPKQMRANDLWFGFTTRARLIVYDKSRVKPEQVQTYADLATPAMRGMVCARSGSHPYMLSLLASIVEHEGDQKAEAWARGVVANLARSPRGGDTDQIKGVISGECGVALANSYYLVRMLKSNNSEERAATETLGIIWPNQKTTGVHTNVSGGGMARYAPHPENARRFLEFLASPQAQAHLANANNEWPAAVNVSVNNPELNRLGKFKPDSVSIAAVGRNQVNAAKIIDRVGWK